LHLYYLLPQSFAFVSSPLIMYGVYIDMAGRS
jgi:hypothetical protein